MRELADVARRRPPRPRRAAPGRSAVSRPMPSSSPRRPRRRPAVAGLVEQLLQVDVDRARGVVVVAARRPRCRRSRPRPPAPSSMSRRSAGVGRGAGAEPPPPLSPELGGVDLHPRLARRRAATEERRLQVDGVAVDDRLDGAAALAASGRRAAPSVGGEVARSWRSASTWPVAVMWRSPSPVPLMRHVERRRSSAPASPVASAAEVRTRASPPGAPTPAPAPAPKAPTPSAGRLHAARRGGEARATTLERCR